MGWSTCLWKDVQEQNSEIAGTDEEIDPHQKAEPFSPKSHAQQHT